MHELNSSSVTENYSQASVTQVETICFIYKLAK